MLWNSQVKAMVEASVLRFKDQANSERKKYLEDAEAFLGADQASYLSKNRNEPDPHWLMRPKLAFNFGKLALETLAYLYSNGGGPRRQYVPDYELDTDEGKKRQDWWDRFAEINKLNLQWAFADYWARYLGQVAIQAMHVEEAEEDGLPAVELVVHMPWRIDVIQDPLRPTKAKEVKILISANKDTTGTTEQLYHIWTTTHQIVVDGDDRILEVYEHNYGRLPFTWIRNEHTAYNFWAHGIWTSLIGNSKTINKQITEMVWQSLFLSGQAAAYGLAEGTAYLAPDGLIEFKNPDGKLERVGANSSIEKLTACIQQELDWWGATINLPNGTFKVLNQPQAGISLIANQLNLEADRQNRIQIFRYGERDVVRSVATVWSAHHPDEDVSIPDFLVSFPDIRKGAMTVYQQVRLWEFRLTQGIADQLDVMQEAEPALTRRQALAKLEDVRKNLALYGIPGADGVPEVPTTGGTD